MELTREIDYEALNAQLRELEEKYQGIRVFSIGESVLGRQIPIVTLGAKEAQKSVLYVATHHASENVCTGVLLKFIEEYLLAYQRCGSMCSINISLLHKMRKIHIVPMLNPDGVEYRLNGLDENNPIRDRIIAYNGGDDFSSWDANARGVDLNHNYNASFYEYKEIERERGISNGKKKYSGEFPESEPEVQSLCNFIRYEANELEGILTLHTQGEEIYYQSGRDCPKRSEFLKNTVSRMTGYRLGEAEDTGAYGGLTDWFIKEYQKPSFTLECGKGKNPLNPNEATRIYSRLRELLYTFPILF